MLIYYQFAGFIAVTALALNLLLLLGGLGYFGATLTLPGIAGMVLSLGMAVDANVLIYERVREEIRAGRTPRMAIDAGYKSATNTITDANLTALISTVFLYIFGSGTVRGFAVTLGIGIVVSMFTAVLVTRFVTAIWWRLVRPKALPLTA
jgi:protein-export membrane protein SecD